jgi:hypothetical protein
MNFSKSLKTSLVYKQKNRYAKNEHLRDIEVSGTTLLAYFHYGGRGAWFCSGDSRDGSQFYFFEKLDDATKDLILSLHGVIPEASGYLEQINKLATH